MFDNKEGIKVVALSSLIPDPNQPRREFFKNDLEKLKVSIKTHGIMTPIAVEESGSKYLIVDGERRFRSAKELNLKKVPVRIMTGIKNEEERNIIRFQLQETHSQWTPLEKAEAMRQLKESLDLSNAELSSALGVHPATCSRYLSILVFNTNAKTRLNRLKLPIMYLEALSKLFKAVPIELSTECPDFVDRCVDKYENGYVKSYRDFQLLTSLIHAGEYAAVLRFFTTEKFTAEKVAQECGYYTNRRVTSAVSKARRLTKDLLILKKNALEFSDTDLPILKKLQDALNDI